MKAMWCLTSLFESELAIKKEIDQYTLRIHRFELVYKIGTFTNTSMLHYLQEYEQISDFIQRVQLYRSLIYFDSTKCISPDTELSIELVVKKYIDIAGIFPAFLSRHEEVFEILECKELVNYSAYLRSLLDERNYFLSDEVERVLMQKDLTGYRSIQQIYIDILQNTMFRIKDQGVLSYNQVLMLLNCEDKQKRNAASRKLGAFFKQNDALFLSLFNYSVQELNTDMSIRGYTTIYEGIFRENEFNEAALELMSTMIYSNRELFQKYYLLRAKLNNEKYNKGISYITDYSEKISINTAINIIISAVSKLSPQYGKMVRDLLKNDHVDYDCRTGKQSGSICFAASPKVDPYIFVNYGGTASDLFTLAHEIGHAIHFINLSQHNTALNYIPSNLQTEIVAVFFETLVCYEYIASTKYSASSVLDVVDNFIGKIFRQAINAIFELRVREKDGHACSEEVEQIWLDLRKTYYGDTVKFYQHEKNIYWSIVHFITDPLLTAVYSISQAIAFSLIDNHRSDCCFCGKFDSYMHLNANESVCKFLSHMFDIEFDSEKMWKISFSSLQNLLATLEEY